MPRPYDATESEYGGLRFAARLPGLDALGPGFVDLLAKQPPARRNRRPDALGPERTVHCGEEAEEVTDAQKRTFDWIESHQDEVVRRTAAAFAELYAGNLAVYREMHAGGLDAPAFPLPDPGDLRAVTDLVRIGDLYLHPVKQWFGFELLFLATPGDPVGVQFRDGQLFKMGVPDLAYAYSY